MGKTEIGRRRASRSREKWCHKGRTAYTRVGKKEEQVVGEDLRQMWEEKRVGVPEWSKTTEGRKRGRIVQEDSVQTCLTRKKKKVPKKIGKEREKIEKRSAITRAENNERKRSRKGKAERELN